MCTEAIDASWDLLESTTNAWLRDSLPAPLDRMLPAMTPVITIMLGLIKRDLCRYTISFAPWPDSESVVRLENIDGNNIEPEPAWDMIAIPSMGDDVWVVKEFTKVPAEMSDLIKDADHTKQLNKVIAKLDKGEKAGTQILTTVRRMERLVKGVPTVLEQAQENQRKAMERYGNFRRQLAPHSRETAVWDGLIDGKQGRKIAKELKLSPATISLVKKDLEKRCRTNGLKAPWLGRGGRPPGNQEDKSHRNVDENNSPPDPEAAFMPASDWAENTDERNRILDGYDKAKKGNEENSLTIFRDTYPDIEAESEARKRSMNDST